MQFGKLLASTCRNPKDTFVADYNAQAAESNSEDSDGEGDVRLHPRAVCFPWSFKCVCYSPVYYNSPFDYDYSISHSQIHIQTPHVICLFDSI